MFVSAYTGEGIEELRERLARLLDDPDVEVKVLVPYTRGDLLSRIHSDGQILHSAHEADGTRVHARVPRALASALDEYAA